MAKKFISVLGISNYSKCKYGSNEKFVETRFIQEAILDLYFGNYNPEDEIVILLTKEAEKKNWRDRVETNKYNGLKDILMNTSLSNEKKEQIRELVTDTEWNGYETSNTLEGLKSILNEKYKCRIKTITIEDGKTEEEIWNIFEKIYDSFKEGDEVIFDITHGFRSIPMLALTVLNYAKVLKNIKLQGIYYGAYEARNKESNIAPIFNLTIYNEILEWASAVSIFVDYGNGAALYDLYKELSSEQEKIGNYSLNRSELSKFVSYIDSFTSCLMTSRGKIATRAEGKLKRKKIKKSSYDSAIAIKDSLEKMKKEDVDLVKPLVPLFEKVSEVVEKFCINNNEEIGIETIKWCIKYGLTQQGYTALEETIKTYVCNKYKIDATTEEYRDNIVKSIMNSKYYKKNRNENYESEEKYKIIKIIEETLPEDIVNLVQYSSYRNDISHFGYSKQANSYDDLKIRLQEGFDLLIKLREKYKNVDFREYKNVKKAEEE